MLLELRIENLAVMERSAPEFGPGFNAITGETGAGKSVLLGALLLALGGRADPRMVRAGCGSGSVSAVFQDAPAGSQEILAQVGILDDDVLVLTRELAASGRSTARANSRMIPVATARELAERLIEVHGQGASSRWLRESDQLAGLDGYAGDEVSALRAQVATIHAERVRVVAEVSRMRGLREVESQELARAEQDLGELASAGLREEEDVELRRERDRLYHSSRLRVAAEQLRQAVGGDGGEGADSGLQLARALQATRAVMGIDPELDRAAGQATEVVDVLQELVLQLSSYLDHLPDDGARLAEVEERLALLERLVRRHGGSLAAAIQRRDEAQALVGERGGLEAAIAHMNADLERLDASLASGCASLSAARTLAAGALERAVTEDLRQMLMPHARFVIRVWQRPSREGVPGPEGIRLECSRDGWDRVSFELAPNSGDRLRPLAESASGGELARVALALLSRLSRRSGVGTVVFDEIDQGLGGEAANRVGRLLQTVAESRQVICVTHLAPIAARASTHLRVVKVEDQTGVSSLVTILDRDQRVDELARLLAGEATPRTARQHAAELLAAVGGE